MSGTGAFSEIETGRLRGGLGIACNLGFLCGGFGDLGMVVPEAEGSEREVTDTPSYQEQQQQHQQQKLVVGYALTSKKKKSFLQPKLEILARKKGIFFVAIDQNRPLSEQGPFDIVLHKLLGKEWQEAIEEKHPEVTILDPPGAIQCIYNRQSMLQGVADLNLSDCGGKIRVPKQMVVLKDATSSADRVAEAGLKFPLVAKPLLVDGTAKSHELFLAYDRFSLLDLEPPLVLQEFVNHGGVLFKVFVVGEIIKVVRRCSLPNVSNCEKSKVAGVFQFPRVSSASASPDDAELDPRVAELPPRSMLERLVKELRTRLGLRLFNVDMIREHGSRDVFYVIDINYFPGYGKMPEYEQAFTDFFLSLGQAKLKKRHCK
ncbi:PREDICTED: inositol-tetrakisphosphate 1-kinase 2 isoform X2 [Tarenaya hassleriana]|uniref:inositol-tetrakisphosphate 1-kinase 2 isoform X2 n=1 Tax=Tarenaya hassleriana TaxID=28532 RepID=UPI00053C3767|nr:PREDICTED: inositol-tetrakisphosphate 1-kinase 2 isoform X2 [Tarenaya hassleriana]